jgi:hypothetical protein
VTRRPDPAHRDRLTLPRDAAWRRLWDRLLTQPNQNDEQSQAETVAGRLQDAISDKRRIARPQLSDRENRTDSGIS